MSSKEEKEAEKKERALMRLESNAGKARRRQERKERKNIEKSPSSPRTPPKYIDEHDDMKIPLPEINEDTIGVPQMFIKYGDIKIGDKMVKGWTVEDIGDRAINKTREISSRKGSKILKVKSAKISEVEQIRHHPIPRLADFPLLEDRRKVYDYLTHLHPEEEPYPENLPRGRPPVLPKNWAYHGLGEIPKLKDYKKTKPAKPAKKVEKKKPIRYTAKDIDWGEESEENEEPSFPEPSSISSSAIPFVSRPTKAKGRPKKYEVEEGRSSKLESNKVKRANREMLKRLFELSMNGFEDTTYHKVSKKDKDAMSKYIGNSTEQINNLEKLLSSFNKKEREDYDNEIEDLETELQHQKKQLKGKGIVNDFINKQEHTNYKEEIPKGKGVDFEDMKWGTLTALYKRFLKQHPDFKNKIEDLDHFAHFIVENPDKFSKIANKKAQFYVNVLSPKK